MRPLLKYSGSVSNAKRFVNKLLPAWCLQQQANVESEWTRAVGHIVKVDPTSIAYIVSSLWDVCRRNHSAQRPEATRWHWLKKKKEKHFFFDKVLATTISLLFLLLLCHSHYPLCFSVSRKRSTNNKQTRGWNYTYCRSRGTLFFIRYSRPLATTYYII